MVTPLGPPPPGPAAYKPQNRDMESSFFGAGVFLEHESGDWTKPTGSED